MNLDKKDIITNTNISSKNTQFTIDDDFNVPDSKFDVDKIIEVKGEISIREIETLKDKVKLSGALEFFVLYTVPNENHSLNSLKGEVLFEEIVNIDGVTEETIATVKTELDDLTIGLINSRKLGIKSLIGLNVTAKQPKIISSAIGLENEEEIKCLHKNIHITQTVIDKKDTYHIKEEFTIPNNKPNISELLWSIVNLRNQDVKIYDGKIALRGELLLFVLYSGDEEHIPTQFIETEIAFNGDIECLECYEGMISNVSVLIGSSKIEIKPDADGEERILDIEVNLNIDIKIYNEEDIKLLQDVYVPTVELIPITEDFEFQNLIIKNNAKARISSRMKIKQNQAKIMQICHVDGNVKIDEMTKTKDGILVDGVVTTNVLYIAGDDRNPINILNGMIPFSYLVEAKKISDNDEYEVTPSIEQLNAIMLDSEEIELKSVINLNIIAFSNTKASAIIDIEEKDIDYEKLKNMPGMIGYIVKSGDTLWNIAKKHYATIDGIKTINGIESDNVDVGDKLLIVKELKEMI